jgi:hypothetical protein
LIALELRSFRWCAGALLDGLVEDEHNLVEKCLATLVDDIDVFGA